MGKLLKRLTTAYDCLSTARACASTPCTYGTQFDQLIGESRQICEMAHRISTVIRILTCDNDGDSAAGKHGAGSSQVSVESLCIIYRYKGGCLTNKAEQFQGIRNLDSREIRLNAIMSDEPSLPQYLPIGRHKNLDYLADQNSSADAANDRRGFATPGRAANYFQHASTSQITPGSLMLILSKTDLGIKNLHVQMEGRTVAQ